ncbi:MAG TPA: class I SAM-dependent methyltransferase, partial [Anaerolineales bacterium]|nr:class I SAM-dependent methyltransferase [Anaerolineales bacterium]
MRAGGPSAFDDSYFSTGTYEKVSFRTWSQYWWSNRFYARLVRRYGPPGGRLLEVGCGLGHLLARLDPPFETYGLDVNRWALEKAAENAPRARLQHGSADDLTSFPSDHFAVLVAKHVVEHLPEPEAAVREFARVLAPGGLGLVSTPNLDSPMRLRKGQEWIGYRDRTHISLRTPAEWRAMLAAAGLSLRRMFSDGFWDPPYVPGLPVVVQRLLYGAPGGLQAILGI